MGSNSGSARRRRTETTTSHHHELNRYSAHAPRSAGRCTCTSSPGLQGARICNCCSPNQLLHATSSCGHINDKNLLQLRKSFDKVWRQRPSLFMLPLPHKHGDSHLLETIANVITSVPFVFIGLQAPRNKVATRMYADSIIGVGVVSSLYHTSRGDARKIFRWGDYAMISASALCLTRALRTENTNGLIVASALLLPFKPSLVTAIHTGLTEATFYRRVSADTRLRGVHALHTASSLLGCALFVADGMLPHTPFIHAVWHLAAAVGVATYNKLLD